MNKNRVELFSDGVFAIVLTLLVLNLRVPASHGLAALHDVTPALIVDAATFFLVGVMWVGHHGALARVDKITHRALLFNLLILFWVTLLPFAAENAADRPLEPLGPSLLAFCCGAPSCPIWVFGSAFTRRSMTSPRCGEGGVPVSRLRLRW